MRILHLVSSMDPALGGVSQAVTNLIPGLLKQGFSNQVLSLDDPDSSFLNRNCAEIIAVGPGQGPWKWCRKLAGWLESQVAEYDAIILHGLWQYPSWAVRRAIEKNNRLSGSKNCLLVMPHGMLDPWFQKDPSRRLKALRNWFFWKTVEGPLVRAADGLLFTCEEELLLARTTFTPYRPKAEYVVGLGSPLPPKVTPAMASALRDVCPGLAPSQPYLIFLGRIHPKKGVDLLIRAYAAFREKSVVAGQGKDIPALVIAGPGLESSYGHQIQELATQLGLSPNPSEIRIPSNHPVSTFQESSVANEEAGTNLPMVHFPGMLTGDAKWGALYGAAAFVLPSHQENFGIAVAEALGCGTPVIISNQVNIWREIEAAGAGFVAPDTVEGTLAALEQWFNARHQNAALSQAARQCAQQHFSIESAAQRLATVLRENITSPSR